MSEFPEQTSSGGTDAPDSWQASVAEFIDARLELIRAEARDAGRHAAKRGAAAGVVIGGLILFWLLFVAGLIGWISAQEGAWPWYLVTLIFAGGHLLAAIGGAVFLRRPMPPSFPLFRNELAKDREWVERLKNPTEPKR